MGGRKIVTKDDYRENVDTLKTNRVDGKQTFMETAYENRKITDVEDKKEKSGYRYVERSYSQNGEVLKESSKQDRIKVRRFIGKTAEISVRVGLTFALEEKYEFGRVDCEVKLPCYVEEVEEAQATAFKMAEIALVQQVDEIKEDAKEMHEKYSKKEYIEDEL